MILLFTYHTGGVSSDDFVHEHRDERVQERERLLARRNRACAAVVQRTDSDGSGGGGGERQLLLHNIVLAEGDDEEDTEESCTEGERDELADILLGELRKQVQTVHGRDGRDEEDTDTASS